MASAMAPATITYQKPGTKPPIYVAGTFSDPAWQLQEMDYDVDTDGEHVFRKEIFGEPGSKIHYKFRIGDGDWWVLNEDTPTVTDIAGNENNELEVQPPKAPPDVVATNGHAAPGQGGNKASYAEITASRPPESGDNRPRPVADIMKEALGRSDPHSGASTPSFARTAAEVADSAALINQEEPEARMPDDEAGRTGFRRMSGTPIQGVASVAAEVADSAQDLDNEEVIIEVEDHSDINFQYETYDFQDDMLEENEPADHQPPLFAHECVGMEGGEEVVPTDDGDEDIPRKPSADEVDPDYIDMNDPTLERFPSNREGIIDTVRKLETGLGEDRVAFDGIPISPVIGSYRPGMEDITGDPFLSSPVVSASPIIPRPSRRLEIPRSPHGSISSNHSSPLSLQAIDEGEEPSGGEEESCHPAVLLSPPRLRSQYRAAQRTDSDEDEGIAMKDSRSSGTPKKEDETHSFPKTPESPSDVISRALQEESPDIEAAARPTQHESLTTPEQESGQRRAQSPRIVIQTAEDTEDDLGDRVHHEKGQADPSVAIDTKNHDDLDVGTSTVVEADSNQIRKRVVSPADRPGTPASVQSPAGVHADHEGGWLRVFFRLLFVDWIGGLISKLWGARRQTLLTAGAAAVFMGVSGWKIYAGNEGR